MKNPNISMDNIGKEAKESLRETMRAAAPDDCVGGCPKCGDYMSPDGEGNAVCCYCEHKEPLEI